MKCYRCRGEMTASVTTHVVELETCCIVVRHVPCLQCELCGETVYTEEVAKQLEKIVEDSRRDLTGVAAFEYAA